MTGNAFHQVFLPPSQAANSAVNSNPRYIDARPSPCRPTRPAAPHHLNNAGTRYLVYETDQTQARGAGNNIAGGSLGLNLPPNTTGRRLSWIERR